MIKKSKTRQGRGYSGLAKMLTIMAMLLCVSTGAWAQTQITQDFENGLGDWTMTNCQNGTGICAGGYEGSYSFRFYYTSNYPQYLISPEIDAAGGGTMSFYYARYSGEYPETFKVGYSTTTNDPTAFTWGDEVTCTNTFDSDGYLEYTYDFPAGTKYVSIACTSPDQFYLYIDGIKIEYAAAEAAPAGYTVSLKDGTEDADKWTIAPAEATTTGVDEGTEITATYSGNRRVKGVKAVKKGGAAPSGPVAINVTSPAVGQVIGSDGKNYAVGSLPSGVTAIALIAFVNQNNGYVIAVAMTDEEGTMGWEAAKEACTAHTPTVTGASWAMPSQEGGWYLLFNAFGGNSNSCTGLNTAIENAGGKALQNGNYWAKLNDAYPYPIGINNGTVTYSKDDSTNHEYRARAVLLINAGNGEVIGT